MKALVRWLRGFRFAYEGIKYALATQQNMKFHFFVSFAALISGLFFHLGRLEILFILLAITLVIVTELINTAVEKAVDLAMPERHPLAKIAKDVAAAAVLVAAVFAIAVGTIVFYAPVARWVQHTHNERADISIGSVWIYWALILLTVLVVETRFSHSKTIRPSLWSAVAFSISTLLSLLVQTALAALLSYTLSGFFLTVLYSRRNRPLLSLLFGALLGSAITWLAFHLHQ